MQDTLISGFRAIMNGVAYSQNFFNYDGFATMLWSSTLSGSVTLTGSERALAFGMNTWNYSVSLYPALRSNGFGGRCLRDQ
jgi:hypothetical protein